MSVSNLSSSIKDVYEEKRMSPDRQLRVDNLIERIKTAIIPEMNALDKFFLVGSSYSGFALDTSDIDLTIQASSSYVGAVGYLTRLESALKKAGVVQSWGSELISWAKIPLLKLKIDGFNVDITVTESPSNSRRNSNLLKAYGELDPRVKPLVVVVKLWAAKNDINNAFRNTLSSYALTLMVIHYLQAGCRPEPVLPSLQQLYPGVFESVDRFEIEANSMHYSSCNDQSLGDLLLGFFRYYAVEFSFSESVIDITAAGTKLRGYYYRANERIQIEDPIRKTNASYTVHKADKFNKIIIAFRKTHDCLSSYKDLGLIL